MFSKVNESWLTQTIIGYSFLLAGISMLGLCGYKMYSKFRFLYGAILVTAKVIDYKEDDSSDEGIIYIPVFEYLNRQQTHTAISDFGTSDRDYTIGDEVEIYINPNLPGSVLVNSFMAKWLAIISFAALGILFTLSGYVCLRIR